MKVVQLRAENYKRIAAVEINPDGNIVTIGGKNGAGKTSVLDAIYVALKGRAANPPKPVRDGEEKATIRLDMGDIVVTRTFTVKEGKPYTDTLKVENADGLRYGNPQEVLDAMLGELGFDPFEFVRKKPGDQADTLLQMVPLPIDLDELAERDVSDTANRRDINRDITALQGQLAGIPKEDVPEDAPDREAMTSALAAAADTNAAIERDRANRDAREAQIANATEGRNAQLARVAELRAEADAIEKAQAERLVKIEAAQAEFDALPALAEPVDVSKLQADLRAADTTLAAIDRQARRKQIETDLAAKQAKSQAFTLALADRERQRTEALAKAKMPIDGLGFGLNEKGKPVVTFGGVPFEQASTAEQLRASTAIAMAANPSLRVLRIKDGSLLDDDSMAMLREMADTDDFQLWIEVVGTGGVGVIMEDGHVRATEADTGTEAPSAAAEGEASETAATSNPPKSKKPKGDDKPEGALI